MLGYALFSCAYEERQLQLQRLWKHKADLELAGNEDCAGSLSPGQERPVIAPQLGFVRRAASVPISCVELKA